MCKQIFIAILCFSASQVCASYCSTCLPMPKNHQLQVCAIEIEMMETFCDLGVYYQFDLATTDVGSSGFIMTDPLGVQHTYSYADLPISFELGAVENVQILSFSVCDIDNPNCCDFQEFENPCYEACMEELSVSATCTGVSNLFNLTIDFTHTNSDWEQFEVFVDNQSQGLYTYNEVPLTLPNFVGDCSNYSVLVVDYDVPECAQQSGTATVCCEPCDITVSNVTNIICDGDQVVFTLDLAYENVGGETFTVTDLFGNESTHNYADLPLEITFPSDISVGIITFTVCADQVEECCATYEIANPCYPVPNCEIGEITGVSTCQPGTTQFSTQLNFEYSNTSTSFTVSANGVSHGTFLYANLPVTISGLEGDCETVYDVVVNDVGNPNCSNVFVIEPLCCQPEPTCDLSGLTVEVLCSNDSTSFTAIVNIGTSANSDSCTLLVNNTSYGTFAIGQFPVTIPNLAADCQTNYQFTVADFDINGCAINQNIGFVCCGSPNCDISIVDLNVGSCLEDSLTYITFDLENSNPGTGFIAIDNNGQVLTYTYDQLPVTLLLSPDDDSQSLSISVCDIDQPNCCAFISFENPCVEPSACELGEMNITTTCAGDTTYFDAVIDFEYTATTMDSFHLTGSGIDYGTYAYGQLPITVPALNGNCQTLYAFVATDYQNPSCTTSEVVGVVCCTPCDINILSVSNITCVGGDTLVLTLDLAYSGTDSIGFTVYDYVGNLSTYTYDQLPIDLQIQAPADVPTVSFTVCDIGTPGCCVVYTLANPCFVDMTCSLAIVGLSNISCTDGDIASVTFDLDYENQGNTGFIVTDDYGNTSTHTYAQLPLTITVLAPTYDQIVGFQVCDLDHPNCCDYLEFANPCYSPPGNRPSRVDVKVLVGPNDFSIKLDIANDLVPKCTFDFMLNGQKMGTMESIDSSVVLGPIECFHADSYHIEILSLCLDQMVWDTTIQDKDIDCISGTNDGQNHAIDLGFQPSTQTFTVSQNIDHHLLDVRLIDIYGRRLLTDQTNAKAWSSSIANIGAGIYILNVYDKSTQHLHTLKIAVVK
jgi:hypothetical protein